MKTKQVISVAILAVLWAGGPAAGQDLVSNGGFELPTVSGTFIQRNAGATMSGWTVAGGGIDHIGSFWKAAAGAQSLDLNAASAGSVYQLLSTQPNSRYVLRFALAGNPAGYSNKVMSVLWNGQTVTNLVFPYYPTNHFTNMGWKYYSLLLSSTATSTRVEFASATGTMPGAQGTTAFYGPALDDVSIVPFLPPHLGMPVVSNNLVLVTWSTIVGLQYQLLASTNLSSWAVASEWLTAGTSNLSLTLPFDPTSGTFFRVQTPGS